MLWRCGTVSLDLSLRPLVMGIVNVTPDSFSDGGLYASTQAAITHGINLLEQGADILDVGGESTRPGALPVAQEQELARVLPVIQALLAAGAVVSVDTLKPAVMQAAISMGAHIVNDVNALRAEGALAVVAQSQCGVVLMHMQGEPRTMQTAPNYVQPLQEVHDQLMAYTQGCQDAGIARDRLVIDPGIGFGKALPHNLALIQGLSQLSTIAPVLLGASRKKMLEHITGKPVQDRLASSLGVALTGVALGAAVVRAHDVEATVDALKVWHAVKCQAPSWPQVRVD